MGFGLLWVFLVVLSYEKLQRGWEKCRCILFCVEFGTCWWSVLLWLCNLYMVCTEGWRGNLYFSCWTEACIMESLRLKYWTETKWIFWTLREAGLGREQAALKCHICLSLYWCPPHALVTLEETRVASFFSPLHNGGFCVEDGNML